MLEPRSYTHHSATYSKHTRREKRESERERGSGTHAGYKKHRTVLKKTKLVRIQGTRNESKNLCFEAGLPTLRGYYIRAPIRKVQKRHKINK